MEKNDFIEKVFGGILGSIAIIAIVVEMILGDFSPEAICGGIKDIASTAIVIILLIAFANEHRKTKGLRGSIEHAMTKLEKGYSPLIRQATASETSGEAKKNKLNRIIRYEIAADTNVLFNTHSDNYAPFFDITIDTPDKIEFYIRKKFFGVNKDDIFDAKKISDKIFIYMKKQHQELDIDFSHDTSGGKIIINFSQPLKYRNDIDMLVDIVDDMIFAYTIVNKS